LQSAPPNGPFANADKTFIAEHAGDAAAQWLGIPGLITQTTPSLDVEVTICDKRGYFGRGSLNGDILTLECLHKPDRQLDVWVRLMDYAGHERQYWVRRVKRKANIKLDAAFRSVRSYLLDGAYALDCFDESESSRSVRAEALFGRAHNGQPEIADILRRGESDVAEVKEWMDVDPGQKKSLELLETVCAFANTRGGVILIGVNRHLQVVGLHTEVQKLAKREGKKSSEALDYYALCLRQRISDGIYPSVFPEIEWVQFAGHDLCRIRVPRSTPGTLHSLYETRRPYVRRGANSVPADGEDLRSPNA
jgi:hypothetical protein